ncbi:hypothetical protein SDC9_173205 [bioreactor metagenome]|uniref:Uncharacterized protein n=1 Tax=bioreactor metagenome TaxID=1076179 RepID=A0A645GHZ3_9ZZZZ
MRCQQRRRRHAQHARHLHGVRLRCGTRVLHIVEDVPHARQIGVARIGQRHLAGSALQKARAHVRFQLGDIARHPGRRHAEQARRRRKAALIHHRLEHVHRLKFVHSLAAFPKVPLHYFNIQNNELQTG